MGLALVSTMTGPLLKVLGTMPRAVFSGVFFIVGVSVHRARSFTFLCNATNERMQWGSIEDNGITKKIVFLWKEHPYIQPHEKLLKLRKRRIAQYIFWQLFGVAITVAISQTIAAIGKCPARQLGNANRPF